ncbi:MAG: acetyl-CoA carboxylase biotin carboxyl carrier protein [Amoebophilaceae bacterium]|nr:acetyl-CoA carboxylase biotin carboxyl carrier protein [Amoebophilaceae bacterium]
MKTLEVQALIAFITESGLQEVHIETADIKLHIKRNLSSYPETPSALSHTPTPTAPPDLNSHYLPITSPMIGTFYRSPHPDAPPFVKEGDEITKGTKLCIIEAMKLYNEIEAEISGKVVKILVDNVSPVEYDQPLFLIDPA